jgi:hypothetical protein
VPLLSSLEGRSSNARSPFSLPASLSRMPRRVMPLQEVRLVPEVKVAVAETPVAVDVAVDAEDVQDVLVVA